ncbi:hypothetical protein Dsin_019123 [Dipteronia sinensis]|uniref:Uncharacterized protein n=1 Tax=Dipteronia sinensis TaxID=43782 RepID=A0AAE0E283_9ROSI|nr:hypothetical protein Dsin_019123 [Dipteronia sinensis]
MSTLDVGCGDRFTVLHQVSRDPLLLGRTSLLTVRLKKELIGVYVFTSGGDVSSSQRGDYVTIRGIVEDYATASGQKNKKLFAEIKERVWNKLKRWNTSLFLAGGKKILIKVVIQAIPTYAMSLFMLSKGLILDIHSLWARFWWGGTDEGFEEYVLPGDALLACRGGWDVPLITSTLLNEDTDGILSLPVSTRPNDQLIRHFKKSWNYLVHSGYKVGRELVYRDKPSASGSLEHW